MVENTGPVWVWPVWSVDDEIDTAEVYREEALLPSSYRPRLKELWLPLDSQEAPFDIDIVIKTASGALFQKSWEVDPTTLPTGSENSIQTPTLAVWNTLREQHGLAPARLSQPIAQVAQGHADYMAVNNRLSHGQIRGAPGYTGASLLDRLKANNYLGAAAEAVLQGEVTKEQALYSLFFSPYHRLVLLRPGSIEAGYAASGDKLCFVAAGDSRGEFVSPPENALDAPAKWTGRSQPHPDPNYQPGREYGFPIVGSFYDRQEARLASAQALLQSDTGDNWPIVTRHPENDPLLKSSVILLPLRPLLPNTEYTVQLNLTYSDGYERVRTWSFRTRQLD